MKSDVQTISYLNKLLRNELVSVNQYLLHAKILKNYGLVRLNEVEYHKYIDETKHVNRYIERILFLEGLPNLQDLSFTKISKNVEEMLHFDLNLELKSVQNLREGITYVNSVHDYVSQQLMTEILIDEEEHISFLETELSLITRIGLQNYLQSQLKNTS